MTRFGKKMPMWKKFKKSSAIYWAPGIIFSQPTTLAKWLASNWENFRFSKLPKVGKYSSHLVTVAVKSTEESTLGELFQSVLTKVNLPLLRNLMPLLLVFLNRQSKCKCKSSQHVRDFYLTKLEPNMDFGSEKVGSRGQSFSTPKVLGSNAVHMGYS